MTVAPAPVPAPPPWWKTGVVYQVYPRSFQDTDGDGVGDLPGVERRLDYLADLGVDALWLSPIFPSPMADFGYDVADYCDVDPRFGTLADFDRLLAAAHGRGQKILLDFVPNHTSDRHPWFVESRSSRGHTRRDWYVWHDPAPGGGPPNNWISDFGGSAWEWDAASGQYYLHAFLPQQPDLNWRNPQVQAAMFDAMRFWFDRGVDGFRIDVLWHIVKAEGFPDNPANPGWREGMAEMLRVLQTHSTDQPEAHVITAGMRRLADGYAGDRVLIGEIYLPVADLVRWYGPADAPEAHMPFNFHLIDTPWNARELHRVIGDYEAALPPGAWPNWVLGNHDRPRIASRVGEAQARVAAVLLLALRGTPTMYYGDELGLADVAIPTARVQDPRELREPGKGLGRDPVRTPMPWDGAPGAGFTTGEPWLPLNADRAERNVAAESADPASMLALYRALLRLRRAEAALVSGDLELLPADNAVLAFLRGEGETRLLVALNLTCAPQRLDLPAPWRTGEVLLTTSPSPPTAETGLDLRPDEAVIVRIHA